MQNAESHNSRNLLNIGPVSRMASTGSTCKIQSLLHCKKPYQLG